MEQKRLRLDVAKATIGLFALFGFALMLTPSARGETTFGVRSGFYTDAAAGFIGGEVLTSIADYWYFDPNLEVALTNDRDVVTVNGDFRYDILHDGSHRAWAGAGPAVIHRGETGGPDTTDLGVNLVGGFGWRIPAKVSPYVQGKVTLSDNSEAVVAVGITF